MPGKSKKQAAETAKVTAQPPPKETVKEAPKEKEIMFVCKFCGQTKPLSEMIMIRNLYPQLASCKECARVTKSPSE